MRKILRIFINILAFYLIGDGVIHIFNIRLQSVLTVWPQSALAYADLLNGIYASFIFLMAALLLVVQKDLKKYKTLILVSSIWAIFHAILLLYLSISQNFVDKFSPFPSLYVWLPFYNEYLFFEAGLAIIYSLMVFFYLRLDK